MGRADGHSGLGHASPARGAHRERDPEVGDRRPPVVEQDVFRLYVAVDDAVAVGVVEGVGHLGGDAHRFLDAQLGFPVELPAQRLAVEERHDVIQEAPLAPGVEEREDVRVLELRGGRDLPEEAFRPQQCREFGAEHLDRDPAVMPEVRGEEDRRHATGADRAVDLVAIAKGGLQLGERVGHEGGSGTSPTYRSSAGRRQPHGPPIRTRRQCVG